MLLIDELGAKVTTSLGEGLVRRRRRRSVHIA